MIPHSNNAEIGKVACPPLIQRGLSPAESKPQWKQVKFTRERLR